MPGGIGPQSPYVCLIGPMICDLTRFMSATTRPTGETESDVFDQMPSSNQPGIVTYTATRWGDLLKPNKMPDGEKPLYATECYRFVMSHPLVDVCMSGSRNSEEICQALRSLQLGPLSVKEIERMHRIGDYVHTKYRRFFG